MTCFQEYNLVVGGPSRLRPPAWLSWWSSSPSTFLPKCHMYYVSKKQTSVVVSHLTVTYRKCRLSPDAPVITCLCHFLSTSCGDSVILLDTGSVMSLITRSTLVMCCSLSLFYSTCGWFIGVLGSSLLWQSWMVLVT